MAIRIFPLEAGKTAWNSTKTQTWSVTEAASASGRRRAICNQVYPQYTFNISFNVLTDDELATLMGFYAKCKGSLMPFWYKDTVDYHAEKQSLAGNSGVYQCVIKIGDYVEPCGLVEYLHVFIDGTETTNYTKTGATFTVSGVASGSVVSASYDYYWQVRFDGDLSVTQLLDNVNRVTLKLTTVR